MIQKKYKIGLSLSGGGAKGIAHIGVLQAMEEVGLKPDIIAGVSAGSIVGALYADGLSPKEILNVFEDSSFLKFVNISSPRKGFLSANKFFSKIANSLRAKTFEDLKIPLVINATDLTNGKIEYFFEGTLLDKIEASSSVPIALSPKEINSKLYVDGGIFCNIPCAVIRDHCETLIGVHVNPIMKMGEIGNVFDVFERVYHLLIQANTVSQKQLCDIVIEPTEARNFGMFEISKCREIFDIGYLTAIEKFKDLGYLK
ncbi:MAG: patatin-like phospholipase family protein [Paludibacteraceae bacterium]|nr:patatin-like phospholipase family protein [Paludibacteraceae bacterium]